jgi:hypothetical protein
MGYTHYWTNVTDLPPLQPETMERIHLILAKHDDILCGPGQEGRPIVTADRVAFNGQGEAGFEDFDWDRFETWDFCKTARNGYDIVVGMVLLTLKEQYGLSMILRSDGDSEDWLPIVTGLRMLLWISDGNSTTSGSPGTSASYAWVNERHPEADDWGQEEVDEQLRRLKLGMDRKMNRRNADIHVGR